MSQRLRERNGHDHYVRQWPLRSLSNRMVQDKVCRSCNTSVLPWMQRGKHCPNCGREFELGPPHVPEYLVSERDNGQFECTCPVWIFNREDCKHIIWIRAHRNDIEEAVATKATKRIESDNMVIDVKDGRIEGFLAKLQK